MSRIGISILEAVWSISESDEFGQFFAVSAQVIVPAGWCLNSEAHCAQTLLPSLCQARRRFRSSSEVVTESVGPNGYFVFMQNSIGYGPLWLAVPFAPIENKSRIRRAVRGIKTLLPGETAG
jgi:hypothetical protein